MADRDARTIAALAGHGITGPGALAALKLIDGLEFDGAGNPANLPERLTAARAIYGDVPFVGGSPAATDASDDDREFDAAFAQRFGAPTEESSPLSALGLHEPRDSTPPHIAPARPSPPNVHQGARGSLDADPDAGFDAAFARAFPSARDR